MKAFTLALSALASLTSALPLDFAKRGGGSGFSEVDITILQFALTLEHLENTFYKDAFASFKSQDFITAGFSEEFFVNLEFIAADESAHVDFLIAAISSAGAMPVQPCQYNFGVTDIASFVTVSAILESIGTSAYLGAAPFISSKEILTVAASIMATEGMHTSLQRGALGAVGAPNPFATPLDANSVFSLASQFIVSCPPSNAPLPFQAFPGLKVSSQPCFNEVGSGSSGSFSTESVNWATVVSNIENSTTTTAAYYSQATDATSTTTAMAMTTTTDMSMATTTTAAASSSTTESAMAMPSASPTYKRDVLEARTFQSACSAPGAGSQIQLVPDYSSYSKSHGVDFSIEIVFVTILSGLDVISIEATFQSDGSIVTVIPPSIGGGQIFIFITVIDISGSSMSNSDVLFGPAVFELAPSFPTIIQ